MPCAASGTQFILRQLSGVKVRSLSIAQLNYLYKTFIGLALQQPLSIKLTYRGVNNMFTFKAKIQITLRKNKVSASKVDHSTEKQVEHDARGKWMTGISAFMLRGIPLVHVLIDIFNSM